MLDPLSVSAQKFVSDLRRLEDGSSKAQRQISSGLKIERPSDDPDALTGALRLTARLAEARQVKTNLERAQAEVDGGEQALESATNLLDRASQIASQAAGTLLTADQKEIFATEAAGLIDRMRALTGAFPSEASEATDLDGFRFAISRTAGAVFEVPLAALEALRQALEAGGALPDLKAVQSGMSEHLAFYGSVQSRIHEALDTAAKRVTSDKTLLAAIREVDLAEAATALTEARTHQEAALAARAKLPRSSLFDYLG